MVTVSEILTELFKNPLPLTWVKQDAKWWKAVFDYGEVKYWASIYAGNWNGEACWTFDFGVDHASAEQHGLQTTAPTGLRQPHSIISSVKAAFDGFMREHFPKPKIIVFYDSDGVASRTRVYNIFANYVCSTYGYAPDDAIMQKAKRQHSKEVWFLRKL